MSNVENDEGAGAVNSGVCHVCGKHLGKNVYAHLFSVHGFTKEEIKHLQAIKRRRVLAIACPLCTLSLSNHRELVLHVDDTHAERKGTYCIENASFENKSSFLAWKHELEEANTMRYTVHSKKGDTTYMRCSRALPGPSYVEKCTNSKKTTQYCTAFMKVTERGESVDVEFCRHHCGHEIEAALLTLSSDDEKQIVSYLKDGFSYKQVINKIRELCKNSGSLSSRFYYTTSRDIRRIAIKNNMDPARRHQNDITSLELRVAERIPEDGIKHYTPASDPSGNDFALGKIAEEKFDPILFSMAQQMPGGVPDLLDVLFGFLARKTDFYSGAGVDEARSLLLKYFEKHGKEAIEKAAESKRKKEEQERKLAEKRAAQKAKEEEFRRRYMSIKTRLRSRRVSLRRSFRTRPSDQTAIICVDHHPEVKLFHEDEWDDEFPFRSPKPRKERRPKHKPDLEEDIIEEEEENVIDNDENGENVDPQVDSDLPAVQELNEKIAIAEEWSFYIENEDDERLKAVGDKLVPYETYTGHKVTAHLFLKREKTPPPSEEEVMTLDRARCDAHWANVDKLLGPVKKKTPIRPTIIMASGTSFRAESAAIERVRKTTRSLAIEPIEETPETVDTEAASVAAGSYQRRCSEASKDAHSTTPKNRLQSTDGRKQKPSLLTASLLDLDDTRAESRTCQELSFSSVGELELQPPLLFSTPMQSAPQAQSTPFDQTKEFFTQTPPQRTDFSSPRWANVTERSKERTRARSSRKMDYTDNPPSTSVVKETETVNSVSTEDEEDELSYMFESDLSLHEDQVSLVMVTSGEESPRNTQNVENTRNVTQTTNTTRSITHLTNASFVDIPFYLLGCENATTASPMQTLLYVIGQPEVMEWNGLPKDVFENPTKLGEGVYGEVFATTYNGRPTAMKVIPFNGDETVYTGKVNGECLMDAASILPEILINRELSILNDPISDFSTPNFVQLLKVNVVRGQYPEAFIHAWDQYDEERESENDRPTDYASDEQLFVTIGMAMGGTDLEHYQMKNEDQVLSTLLQVAISLLVAEDRLEFEHRDLHIGNVLVIEEDADLEYKVKGGTMVLRSYGVKVNIIDFTLSRMRKEGTTLYRDLEADEELFTGSGDYQFDIYRMMRHENKGDWLSFNSKTNCFWLHYLSKYLISEQKCKKAIPKKRKQALQSVWDQLLNFDSIGDMFTKKEFIEVLKKHLTVIPRYED